MTTEPDHAPAPPPEPPQTFSAAALIGGLFSSLFLGAIGAFFAGLMAMSTGNKVLSFFIGLAPGAIFVITGVLMKRKLGFAQGLIIGGCIIGLIGGICGSAMVGTSFR